MEYLRDLSLIKILMVFRPLHINSTSFWTAASGSRGMHFSRYLNVDKQPIDNRTNSAYMVAVGSPYPNAYSIAKHVYWSKEAVFVNFDMGITQSIFVWTMKETHGLLMYLGLGLCIPFGLLFARYGKQFTDALWLEVHRFAMTIGFIMVLSGLEVAFEHSVIKQHREKFELVHAGAR